MNPQRPDNNGDTLAMGAIVALGAVVGLQWASAYVAAFLGGERLDAGFGDGLTALLHLPSNGRTPAAAWPEPAAAQLPGPLLYWATAALVHLAGAFLLWGLWRGFNTNPAAIDRRRRLGVDAQPHIARRRDLKTLLVRRPEPGRYLLGRSHRRLVATEKPISRRRHRTTPGAVAVLAPSRSGKTVSTITAANRWHGPAILSSVKRDLIDGTFEQRAQLGEIRIYDPTHSTGARSNAWTPLHNAASRRGATRAARMLLGATGHDRTGNGQFWTDQAETLLASLLWLAANTAKPSPTSPTGSPPSTTQSKTNPGSSPASCEPSPIAMT